MEEDRGLMDEKSSIIFIPVNTYFDNKTHLVINYLLDKGWTVVILDENGFSNSLLEFLGVNAKIQRSKVLDEIEKTESRNNPIVTIEYEKRVYKLATIDPSYIDLEDSQQIVTVGVTSKYSYVDRDENNFYSLGEEMNNHVIIAVFKINKGDLWLIADLDMFSNGALNRLDNLLLMENIVDKRSVYLNVNQLNLKLIDKIKVPYYRLEIYSENSVILGIMVSLIIIFLTGVLTHDEK